MSASMLILGAGKMARAIALDLSKQEDVDRVTVAARNLERVKYVTNFVKNSKLKTAKLDIQNGKALRRLMKDHDCAISAVPYNYNYMIARAAVDAGCNMVDLGGNIDVAEKEFSLSKRAKKKGIAIVPSVGLAPGLVSNLTALGMKETGKTESVKIYVGGLPLNPKPPLNYMIVFSVNGLINEYYEDAVVLENYRIRKVPSLERVERISFPGFGSLEAFSTSGGTSTMPGSFKGKIKFLEYKTIRYPGHVEKMRLLKDLGMMSSKKRKINNNNIIPRQILQDFLVEKLSYKDKDVVLLRVIVEGRKKRVFFELIDYQRDGLTAMMRCTGFPAAVISEMIVTGEIEKKGTLTNELDIPPDIVFKKLRKRGLNIKRKIYKK